MNLDTLLTIAAALDASINELSKSTYDAEISAMLADYEAALAIIELQISILNGAKHILKAA